MPGFLATLLFAALAGWIGEILSGHRMPGSVWGAMLAGLVGSWIGGFFPYFSSIRPVFWGVSVIPSIIGAAIAVSILGLFRAKHAAPNM